MMSKVKFYILNPAFCNYYSEPGLSVTLSLSLFLSQSKFMMQWQGKLLVWKRYEREEESMDMDFSVNYFLASGIHLGRSLKFL